MNTALLLTGTLALLWVPAAVLGGPYSASSGDGGNASDAPVPGFIGPAGPGKAPYQTGPDSFINQANRLNPLFLGWADAAISYVPASPVGWYSDPSRALGPVTGDEFDVVSLGESGTPASSPPGQLTVHLSSPVRDMPGADLAVFENALRSAGGSGTTGQVFGELAYIEVSTDGVTFARFPSVSLTSGPVGTYKTFDSTDVFNLLGKHQNAHGDSWGTPFDLAALSNTPEVTSTQVDLQNINYVRMVDIPGNGGSPDGDGQPVYDPFPTTGSGGADIEAVGIISRTIERDGWLDLHNLTGTDRDDTADPDGNGVANLLDYAFASYGIQGAPTRISVADDRAQITLTRDARASDLIYEVCVSDDLLHWETIARSAGGQPFVAVGGYSPVIVESSASSSASIEALRKVTVSDIVTLAQGSRRFLRMKVTALSP